MQFLSIALEFHLQSLSQPTPRRGDDVESLARSMSAPDSAA
jgi:hypothetical protein